MQTKMLCISYDESLLRTRQLLFEHEGYEVTSAFGYVEGLEHCRAGHFDLAFIGHSVPHVDKASLAGEFVAHNEGYIVATTMLGEDPINRVHFLPASVGPQMVLEAIRNLLQR
jgi:CheY-like chemotaxis protein